MEVRPGIQASLGAAVVFTNEAPCRTTGLYIDESYFEIPLSMQVGVGMEKKDVQILNTTCICVCLLYVKGRLALFQIRSAASVIACPCL
jgi:hypothetical protein